MNNKGFTLPEILVVTTVIVVFVVVSIILLRPANLTNDFYDAQRRTDIAELARALQRYKKDIGKFPVDIPVNVIGIGSSQYTYNLCPAIVPTYLSDLPFDPHSGLKAKGDEQTETTEPCNAQDVSHVTGYSIVRNPDSSLTLSAPGAVGPKIEIIVR
ncbi:MAG: prepilin-type N-terminal cleavage/methylation domain-containing protein [Candidatus Saccharimonadales bacterium]